MGMCGSFIGVKLSLAAIQKFSTQKCSNMRSRLLSHRACTPILLLFFLFVVAFASLRLHFGCNKESLAHLLLLVSSCRIRTCPQGVSRSQQNNSH